MQIYANTFTAYCPDDDDRPFFVIRSWHNWPRKLNWPNCVMTNAAND